MLMSVLLMALFFQLTIVTAGSNPAKREEAPRRGGQRRCVSGDY